MSIREVISLSGVLSESDSFDGPDRSVGVILTWLAMTLEAEERVCAKALPVGFYNRITQCRSCDDERYLDQAPRDLT